MVISSTGWATKNEININNHILSVTFSPKNIELASTAKGIASCEPMIIGATIVAFCNDKFKKIKTPKPMDREKPAKGNWYFLLGILNLQKGARQIKSMNILRDAAKIGDNDVFNVSLLIG